MISGHGAEAGMAVAVPLSATFPLPCAFVSGHGIIYIIIVYNRQRHDLNDAEAGNILLQLSGRRV